MFIKSYFLQASGLGDALYFSDWETEGVHQKKAVCIVIQRCQKVPKLYGSHFFTLSVQTFVEVTIPIIGH